MMQTAFLVTAVLVVRRLFGERLHPYIRYSLWLLVALRLFLPVNVFHSPVSIPGGVEQAARWYSEQAVENSPVSGKQKDVILSAAAEEPVSYEEWSSAGGEDEVRSQSGGKEQDIPENHTADGKQVIAVDRVSREGQEVMAGRNAGEEKPVTADQAASGLRVSYAIGAVWLLGSLLTGGLLAVSCLHFRRRLYKMRKLYCILPPEGMVDRVYLFQKDNGEGERGAIQKGEIPVYLVKGLESPCLAGIFRPAIYIGTDVDTDSDIFRYAVAHEKVHFLHKDHLWAVLRILSVIVYWFHPFVWIAAAASARDGEIACDHGTVQRIGREERFAYGEMLLEFSRSKGRRIYSYGTMLQPGRSELKERIVRLTEIKRIRGWAGILTVIFMIVLTGCAFTGVPAERSEGQGNPVLTDDSGEQENLALTDGNGGQENLALTDGSGGQEKLALTDDSGEQENLALTNNSKGQDNPGSTDGAEEQINSQKTDSSENEFGEVEVKTAAELSAETVFGADGPWLDYAGKLGTGKESVIIFHDYFGLVVYDLLNERAIRCLDLKSIGCHMTQGDDACQVAVSADGTTIWLHPTSKRYYYRYDVEEDRLYKEALVKTFKVDLEGEELFDRYLVTEGGSTEYTGWQSNYLYEEYKDERGLQSAYIYLYIPREKEQTLGSLELVWDDMVFILKWENLPGETDGFPLHYDGAVNDVEIIYDKPCNYSRISDEYQSRVHPLTQETVMHEGIDFAAKEGTDITAAADGVVYETGYSEKYGNYAVLLHINGDLTYYCHCREVTVKKEDQVKRGQKIATVGTTGRSTGPHLHFALSQSGYFVDPADHMQILLQLE